LTFPILSVAWKQKTLLEIQTNFLLSVHRRYNFILDEFI